MPLTTYFPGMARGQTLRNILVSVVYLVCFPLVPFVLAFAVFANYNQISDRLALRNTPGFSPGGGVKPAAVTLIVLVVTISIIASLTVAPFLVLADNGGGSDAPTEDGTGSGGDDPEAGDDADSTGTDGFDGGEFVGEIDSEENLSEEEKADLTYNIFESMLVDNGYEISDGEMDEDTLHVEYRSYSEDQDEMIGELVDFAEDYAVFDDVLQEEFAEEYDGRLKEQTEGLHVTILDYNGVEQGSYYIEGEWARAYAAGEITGEEYTELVVETVDMPDHFSENDGDGDNNDNSSN